MLGTDTRMLRAICAHDELEPTNGCGRCAHPRLEFGVDEIQRSFRRAVRFKMIGSTAFFPFPSQPYFLSKKAPASGGCPLHLRPSRACNIRAGTLFLYRFGTVNCLAEPRNQCRQHARCGGSLRRGQSVLCRARVISLRASAIRHRRLSVGGEEGGCPLLAMGLDSFSPSPADTSPR